MAGLILFLIAAAAESNRSPFDLPEGESEIIAGFLTEYSGFKYALFFLGEYLGLFAVTGLAVTLFLGRLARAVPMAGMGSFVGLVRRQIRRADFSLHLGARNAAALAPGPTAEFLLEISGAAGADQSAGGGGVVLDRRPGSLSLALPVRWLLCAALIVLPYVWLGGRCAARHSLPGNTLMLNEIAFLLCAALTLACAVAAMTLRNLVHCALCAAAAFAGLATIYLQLDAEFVGFAQFLVYVGAVAILDCLRRSADSRR